MLNVKVGDEVIRRLGDGAEFMRLKVTGINHGLIECGNPPHGWTFDLATGVEVDEELHWGPKYGVTGTYIEPA